MNRELWDRWGRFGSWLLVALLILALSSIGVAGLVAAMGGKAKVVAAGVGSVMFLVAGFASGNFRLFCLYALVFLAPIPLSKNFAPIPHMGGSSAPGIYTTDILLVVLLGYQIRDFIGGRMDRPWSFPWPLKWFLLFVSVGLITVVTGPYRTLASYEVIRGLQMVFFMFVATNELRNRTRMMHALTAMMLAVCFQSLFGVAQYFYGKPFGLEALGEMSESVAETLSAATLEGGEASFRISSLLGHANLLAIFIASQIPIFLGLLFTRTAFWWRSLAAVSIVLGASALVLTLSRTGWVAAAVGVGGIMVATLFHARLRGRFLYGRMGFVAAVALFGLAFSGPIIKRLTKSDAGAVDIRWELNMVAWEMGKSEPLTGKGLNSFIFQMAPYTKYKTEENMTDFFGPNWPVAHNLYAIIWAEQGTIGMVSFLVAMAMMGLWAMPNCWSRDSLIAAVAMGCLLGFVAYLLDWLASFSLRMDTLGRCFSLHMATYFALELMRRDRLKSEPGVLPATGDRS